MTSNSTEQDVKEKISFQLTSEIIRHRLKSEGARFHANDNISDYIFPGEIETLQKEVAMRVKELLKSLLIDVENDHNSQETAERVSRM